jgi:hypothetical protein
MLEVACHRCERRGRLSIARLIAEHGTGVLDLCAIIAADCPRMVNPATDRCGVHFPELPRWFSAGSTTALISRCATDRGA